MIEASHFDAERSLRIRRSPSAARFQSAHLSHAGHRQDLAGDHARAAGGRLRAHGQGRSAAARTAVRRHRARRLHVVRRRRHVAVAAAESAGDVDARLRDSWRRSDRRHAWPRLLGDRRHLAAAPDQRSRWRAPTRFCSSRPTRSTRCRAATTARRLQKDEPRSQNPPDGAYIDYYLKSAATGPVDDRRDRCERRGGALVHERCDRAGGSRRWLVAAQAAGEARAAVEAGVRLPAMLRRFRRTRRCSGGRRPSRLRPAPECIASSSRRVAAEAAVVVAGAGEADAVARPRLSARNLHRQDDRERQSEYSTAARREARSAVKIAACDPR